MKSKSSRTQVKQCAVCGGDFLPRSSAAKYCRECSVKVEVKQNAERVRRYRERQRKIKQTIVL